MFISSTQACSVDGRVGDLASTQHTKETPANTPSRPYALPIKDWGTRGFGLQWNSLYSVEKSRSDKYTFSFPMYIVRPAKPKATGSKALLKTNYNYWDKPLKTLKRGMKAR